ncbi:Hypp2203 [Branchiostoma lanceolatum]|uniref:Hypp2203 protein n=1 Tax=Branchiostoma lanceolatum TaxID=7740 RepID=A0A8K0EM25_BRALA|nr:Hypp2203 [Branchiostoma lanceolatum]
MVLLKHAFKQKPTRDAYGSHLFAMSGREDLTNQGATKLDIAPPDDDRKLKEASRKTQPQGNKSHGAEMFKAHSSSNPQGGASTGKK